MDASKEAALLGEVKSFHSFNGAIQVPRGWMKCNGNVINEANYDAIHGSGAFVSDGIAALILNGKYTPNLNNKYLVGSTTTTQTGASAITSVGNTGHTSPGHNHQMYDIGASVAHDDYFYKADGTLNTSMFFSTKNTGAQHMSATGAAGAAPGYDLYTANASDNVQPESIQVIFIIRVGI